MFPCTVKLLSDSNNKTSWLSGGGGVYRRRLKRPIVVIYGTRNIINISYYSTLGQLFLPMKTEAAYDCVKYWITVKGCFT